MRVIYTRGALSDLETILGGLESINPLAAAAVERSISATVVRVGDGCRQEALAWLRSGKQATCGPFHSCAIHT